MHESGVRFRPASPRGFSNPDALAIAFQQSGSSSALDVEPTAKPKPDPPIQAAGSIARAAWKSSSVIPRPSLVATRSVTSRCRRSMSGT